MSRLAQIAMFYATQIKLWMEDEDPCIQTVSIFANDVAKRRNRGARCSRVLGRMGFLLDRIGELFAVGVGIRTRPD